MKTQILELKSVLISSGDSYELATSEEKAVANYVARHKEQAIDEEWGSGWDLVQAYCITDDEVIDEIAEEIASYGGFLEYRFKEIKNALEGGLVWVI